MLFFNRAPLRAQTRTPLPGPGSIPKEKPMSSARTIPQICSAAADNAKYLGPRRSVGADCHPTNDATNVIIAG